MQQVGFKKVKNIRRTCRHLAVAYFLTCAALSRISFSVKGESLGPGEAMEKVQEEAETTLGMLAFDAFPRFLKSKFCDAVMEGLKKSSDPNEVSGRCIVEFTKKNHFCWRPKLGILAQTYIERPNMCRNHDSTRPIISAGCQADDMSCS